MSWMGKRLIAAIWIMITQTLSAQPHYNLWFRASLSFPLGPKFIIDNQFQHRRQNGFENTNMLDQNLMFTYRIWLNHQHNEHVRFSISPFAYFSQYRIIRKQEDESTQPNREIRFSAAVEMEQKIWKKFYVLNRTAIEYRLFYKHANIIRSRNRLELRYHFTDKVKLSVLDEIFLNAAGTPTTHIFDHNRIGFNLEYKALPRLKFEAGYLYITRLPLTYTTQINENNFYLNVTYQLPSCGRMAKQK